MAKIGLWFGIILAFLIFLVVYEWPDNKLRLTMCDVGQGDSLVFSKGYSQVLVDVGPENGDINSCLEKLIPFWDKRIEAVIITHSDNDHSGALDRLMSHYQVDKIITSPGSISELTKMIDDRSLVLSVWKGTDFTWLSGKVSVLWPESADSDYEDENLNSLVTLWKFGEVSILLTGDIDTRVEEKLITSGNIKPVTILKISHHGSKTSSSEPFLGILQPSQAWISVGKDNRYGHPSPEVLDSIQKMGIELIRTDLKGNYTMMLE